MKKSLLIAAATVALLAAPALAQKNLNAGPPPQQPGQMGTTGQATHPPRLFTGKGITEGNAVYDCTGKYLGSDPDPSIRSQLLKSQGDASCQ